MLAALFVMRRKWGPYRLGKHSACFWAAVLFLSLASSVGAFLLLNFAAGHIESTRVALFTNCSTVISVLLGIFVMGDAFSPVQLAGVVLIVGSMFVVSAFQGR